MVVGGNFSVENQFPHHASIYYHGQNFCGGSIISSIFILTAAHCIKHGIDELKVVVGANSRKVSQNQQYLSIEQIKTHEKYVGNLTNRVDLYDIALIMLEKPLKFSESVRPIELGREGIQKGSTVTIIGFGSELISGSGPRPDRLKFTSVLVKSINDSTIFLESPAQNQGSCSVRSKTNEFMY